MDKNRNNENDVKLRLKAYVPPKVTRVSKSLNPQMCVRCGCHSGSSSGGV